MKKSFVDKGFNGSFNSLSRGTGPMVSLVRVEGNV